MTKSKYPVRFMDGTPVPEQYQREVGILIKDACDAEEIFTLDELEAEAERQAAAPKCPACGSTLIECSRGLCTCLNCGALWSPDDPGEDDENE